jgi:hypothetical protein
VGERICLRCDWSGVDKRACPRCRAPLYRVSEITTPREVTPIPRPQPQPAGDPIPSSPLEVPQEDDSVLPAVTLAASRRWWVIVGAFTAAALWIVATSGPFDRLKASTPGPALVATTPVSDPPTVNPADAAAEEVALGFLDAYAAFDAQKAMTYVAADADLTGAAMDAPALRPWRHTVAPFGPKDGPLQPYQGPASTEGLSLMLSLLKAVGYEQTVTSCEAAAFGSGTSVVCDYEFHTLMSDRVGRGPFSGSSFVFTVRDGAIVRALQHWNVEKFGPQMWEPFAAWVSSTYPKDAAVMYLDGTLSTFRLSPESIRLWERHTREYAEEVKQGTA